MRTEQMTLDPFFVFRQCHTKSWWTDPRLLQSIYPWARYWTSSRPWYWNKNGGSSSTHSHGESWHQKVVVIWTYNELNQLWSNLLAQCYTLILLNLLCGTRPRTGNNTFMHHIVHLHIEQIWKVKALMTHCEEMWETQMKPEAMKNNLKFEKDAPKTILGYLF